MKIIRNFTFFLLLFIFAGPALAVPVDINSADASTIAAALRGIGDKKAQAIVAYREKNGPFQSVDQLVDVKGIGQGLLAKIRSDIRLDSE
jgi:competence protein ComEA